MPQEFNTKATIITLFGATGDLSHTKIFPALYQLYVHHQLPHSFTVIGMTHRIYGDKDFRDFLENEVFKDAETDQAVLEAFLQHVIFVSGEFEDVDAYMRVGERIVGIEKEIGLCPNKLFYLSTSPYYYETILQNLARSEIASACNDSEWSRILIEKPFGKDVTSAMELDKLLGELFQEKQIFRIDHYLAKEAVQNLVTFRFVNTIFEPVWNKEYIKSVTIKMCERGGVEGRGGFYDVIGALRDVGQNHILQMLALVTMDECTGSTSETIHEYRARVLSSLRPIAREEMKENVVRGQYEGYTDIKGVARESDTETYFDITAYIDSERWQDVPFRLVSGKALREDDVEIAITFHNDRSTAFLPAEVAGQGENILIFQIRPDESITFTLWVGLPGIKDRVVKQTFSFKYSDLERHEELHMNAYEKVLYNCISGDMTVFPSTDEVMAAWRFITPIIENFDTIPLEKYEIGSDGPMKK